MGLFTRLPKETVGALIVDIGSGSVGLAIVQSTISTAHPDILWSHREFSLIRDLDADTWSLREINTALINAFLKLGSEGLKVLHERAPRLALNTMEVTVSAPWTYTVSQTVHYSEEHPFAITDTLVEELAETASKKATEAVLEQSQIAANGLVTIDNQTIGVLANDYALTTYDGLKAKDIVLIQLTALSHQRILEALIEVRHKMLPRTDLVTHSFMSIFFSYLRNSSPDTTECCLIDVTNEATEIGIVRDNMLRHTSHTAAGAYTLAREIATLSKVPKEEAYAYLRGGESFILNKLSESKQAALNTILETYEATISMLFKETGDTLAIPQTIFLHCDADTEQFFIEHLKRAAERATGMQHEIHPISSTFIDSTKPRSDTPILLSANHFHRERLAAL